MLFKTFLEHNDAVKRSAFPFLIKKKKKKEKEE